MLPFEANSFDLTEVKQSERPSKTWYLDSEKRVLRKGIDGLNATLQAAFIALQTERYGHVIFSWQYGAELRTLIGKDEAFVFSEAKRQIADALSTDSRITEVRDFSMQNGAVTFTLDTIFGSGKLTVGAMKR